MSKTVITLDLPMVGSDPTQKVLPQVSLEFLWHWKVCDWYLETKFGRKTTISGVSIVCSNPPAYPCLGIISPKMEGNT